jgi:hypothetical protein
MADSVEVERLVAGKIKDILALTVFALGMSAGQPMFAHIHTRQRFPSSDVEDEALFATDDPVLGDKRPLTNVVEIGIPTVAENEYTSDEDTELIFEYPITFNLGVVDVWDKDTFEFNSSGEMFIGAYMRARYNFKRNRNLGLGQNVTHYYLQQPFAETTENEKGEAVEHIAEWSLTVVVSGVKL